MESVIFIYIYIYKYIYIILKQYLIGAEDIKTHMDEFKEELSLGQRLTDTDILELHILIEQASHEIRQHRPEVSYEFYTAKYVSLIILLYTMKMLSN